MAPRIALHGAPHGWHRASDRAGGRRFAGPAALLTAAAAALAVWLAPRPARAQIPEILRPGSRPMFFVAGFGPSFYGLAGKYGQGTAITRFKLTQDFGYHFSGKTEGPAIGASIAESFGWGAVGFQPGFKFWWDIQPVKNLGVYIAPTGKAGYALFAGWGAAGHGINFEIGAEGRLVLGDRGFVFLRPISADMIAVFLPAAGFVFDWDMSLGGGLIF